MERKKRIDVIIFTFEKITSSFNNYYNKNTYSSTVNISLFIVFYYLSIYLKDIFFWTPNILTKHKYVKDFISIKNIIFIRSMFVFSQKEIKGRAVDEQSNNVVGVRVE